MKKKLIFVFLILIYFQGYSQLYNVLRDKKGFDNANVTYTELWDYKPFTSIGDSLNGKPHGKWIDLSSDSVIYREAEYCEGVPVGTWRVNNPRGGVRKSTVYDSHGNVIEWTQFDLSTRKLIEIIPETSIDPTLLYYIAVVEEDQFQKMALKFNQFNGFGQKTIVYTIHPIFEYIGKLFAHFSFSGSYIRFEDSNKNRPSVKYFFDSGIELKKHYYNYSGNRLKSISVYQGETFIEKTYYDKHGNVKKVKKAKAFG
jgi:hypothetical protein